MEQELLELIRGVKSGRHEDFEVLKVRYMPLILDMASSFEESGAGAKDDLVCDAQRALLKAAVTFDENKEGITFGLFAKICIKNALISVRRAEKARQRRQSRTQKETELRSSAIAQSFEDIDPDEILKKLESSLSDYEAAVFREFFFGRSAKETAVILGTDAKSVNNAVFRIRQKARNLSKEKQ